MYNTRVHIGVFNFQMIIYGLEHTCRCDYTIKYLLLVAYMNDVIHDTSVHLYIACVLYNKYFPDKGLRFPREVTQSFPLWLTNHRHASRDTQSKSNKAWGYLGSLGTFLALGAGVVVSIIVYSRVAFGYFTRQHTVGEYLFT